MSDDIVQGLRYGQLTEKRANQAADRIEELEAENRDLRDRIQTGGAYPGFARQIKEALDE